MYNGAMENTLPAHLFWDTDPDTLDMEQHRVYIIERVLEHGREEDARWLFRQYSRSAIAEIVNTSRRLSQKSKNYWGIILGLWNTPPQSAKQPAKIWKY